MKKVAAILLVLIFVMTGFVISSAEPDKKGGMDHPLLSRMPNFFIEGYEDKEFDSHKFVMQAGKPATPVEGHVWQIRYKLNKGADQPGELKIRRNIQDALKKIGGKVVFDDNFNRTSTVLLKKGEKETWVEVRSYNNMYRLSIVEKETMKQDVVANASAMANDISMTGHVSLYGIYFDTDKSEIKPESDAAISEIAKLLTANAWLNLYIVGHTDNTGTFTSNMKLSQERAAAVEKTLTEKFGIAASRLKSYGVASLSPVTSNDTEDGKAKNRRVELVKQ